MTATTQTSSTAIGLGPLSQAAYEEAKRWLKWEFCSRVAILAVTAAALLLPTPIPYWLALAALLLELVAWWLHRTADSTNDCAREARRRAVLGEALGATEDLAGATDLKMEFSDRARAAAQRYQTEPYYDSKQPPGVARLREVLQESVFWSKHLYRRAARRAFAAWGSVLALVILAALVALPLTAPATGLVVANALVLLLSFLVALDGLGRGFAWQNAAAAAARLDSRLEHLDTTSQAALLSVFGDYADLLATAPVIPTRIYGANRDRLNQLWVERRPGR